MSRHPSAAEIGNFTILYAIRKSTSDEDLLLAEKHEHLTQTTIVRALYEIPNNAITIDDISSAASSDSSYKTLLQTIQKGFPETRNKTDPLIREYWQVRDRLSSYSGIVLLDQRILIPKVRPV